MGMFDYYEPSPRPAMTAYKRCRSDFAGSREEGTLAEAELIRRLQRAAEAEDAALTAGGAPNTTTKGGWCAPTPFRSTLTRR